RIHRIGADGPDCGHEQRGEDGELQRREPAAAVEPEILRSGHRAYIAPEQPPVQINPSSRCGDVGRYCKAQRMVAPLTTAPCPSASLPMVGGALRRMPSAGAGGV